MNYLLNLFLTLFLCALSFYAGKRLADSYHEKAAQHEKDMLERQYIRLRSGCDWNDPAGPYQYYPQKQAFTPELLKQFENRMNETGKATVQFKNN